MEISNFAKLIKRSVHRALSHIFFLVLIFSLNSYAQTSRIDSLMSLLTPTMGQERMNTLYELTYEYIDSDYAKAFGYIQEAYSMAIAAKDSFNIVKMGRAKSTAYRRMNKLDSSLNLSLKILPIAEKHNNISELKHIYHGLALVYLHTAFYDKALLYFFESLRLREREGDMFEISVVLHNIGFTYYYLEEFDIALKYFHQALDLRMKSKNNATLDMLLFNISLCYIYQNDLKKAQEYLDRASSLCDSSCSDLFLLTGEFNKGLILYRQDDLSGAESEFVSSYSRAKKIGHERLQLDNIEYLMKIYGTRRQLTKVEQYFREAESLLETGTPFNQEIIYLYRQIIVLYKTVPDPERVAYYQSKYIELHDSIFSKRLTTNLMKLEAAHLERENLVRIESQNKILALNEEVINQQSVATASIAGISVLLILLTILLARNNFQKRRVNFLLENRVKERTVELVKNQEVLQRAWQERDIIIQNASTDLQSLIATMKGLSTVGKKEVDHPKAPAYWKELDMTSARLSIVLNKMQRLENDGLLAR